MAGILVVAEHLQGELRDISKELIGAATSLKEGLGGPVKVAVFGVEASSDLVNQVNMTGVDEILVVADLAEDFDPESYEEATLQIGMAHRPRVVLIGHTVSGMAYAPALAARLGSGFASDVIALSNDQDELVVTRDAYGNKVNLELGFPGKQVVIATLRSATFSIPEGVGNATVTSLALPDISAQSTHVAYEAAPQSDLDVSKAEFLLSIGRGIQDEEHLQRFVNLAEKLGATLSCSRPLVDAGWLPKQHQVGQSGKIASNCRLYIALGISGAVQHLTGMKHVETIIAVNKDTNAPIFNVATYGCNIDLFELTEALESRIS